MENGPKTPEIEQNPQVANAPPAVATQRAKHRGKRRPKHPSKAVPPQTWRWIEAIADGAPLARIPKKPKPGKPTAYLLRRRALHVVAKRLNSPEILAALTLHCLESGREGRLCEILRQVAYLQLARGLAEGDRDRMKAGETGLGSLKAPPPSRAVQGARGPRPADGPGRSSPSRPSANPAEPAFPPPPGPPHALDEG